MLSEPGTPRDSDQNRLPRRSDPAVASIARAWRTLSSGKSRRGGRRLGPGEPILLAYSGGADSSALAIALRAVTDQITLAHIIHDMRPRADALADRDAVRALALRLDVPFVQAEVSVHPPAPSDAPHADRRPSRNIEQIARRNRYAALRALALENGLQFIATAHHAQDQFETLLMRLLRGTGLRGLRGIAPRRRIAENVESDVLPPDVWLIRPMLALSRLDAERLCSEFGWAWRDDATNRDTTRVRAALRADVIPHLLRLAPGAASRSAQTAELLRSVANVIDRAARSLDRRARVDDPASPPTPPAWRRDSLRSADPAVLGAMIRRILHDRPDAPGADRLGFEPLNRIVDAIRGDSRDTLRFLLRHAVIEVTANLVLLRDLPHDSELPNR